MADREAWYGDVGDDVPVDDLLSSAYAAERRALIGDTASTEPAAGLTGRAPASAPRPRLRRPRSRPARAGAGIGEPTVDPLTAPPAATPATSTSSTAGATCVSATPSGGWLQSRRSIPALGFPSAPAPRCSGSSAGCPTRWPPASAPRTTLTPSLALRGGVPAPRLRHARRRPAGAVAAAASWLRHLHRRDWTCRRRSTRRPGTPRAFPSSFYPRESDRGRVVVESRLGDAVRRRAPRAEDHDVTVAGPVDPRAAQSAVEPGPRDGHRSGPRRTRAGCRATPSAAEA